MGLGFMVLGVLCGGCVLVGCLVFYGGLVLLQVFFLLDYDGAASLGYELVYEGGWGFWCAGYGWGWMLGGEHRYVGYPGGAFMGGF